MDWLLFDAVPVLDLTFHFDTDPDPDSTPYTCWKFRKNLPLFTAVPFYIVLSFPSVS